MIAPPSICFRYLSFFFDSPPQPSHHHNRHQSLSLSLSLILRSLWLWYHSSFKESYIPPSPERKKRKINMGSSPHIHHQPRTHLLTNKFISRAIYILIPLALLHFYLFPLPITTLTTSSSSSPSPQATASHRPIAPTTTTSTDNPARRPCNYTDGRWIPTERAPLYNGTSCGSIIKPGQNCMAHGRPDTAYLRYRWQPRSCPLPPFDPHSFLSHVRNRHVAFVGDSMARNQLESLLCLLSSSSPPQLTYRSGEDNRFRRWLFPTHNATFSIFWSPFLVKGLEKSPQAGLNHNKLFLDAPDDAWAAELSRFDVIVFSIGHWFLHPAIYLENDRVLGCHHCPEMNGTEEIGFFDVFRKAVRTALRKVREEEEREEKKRLVVVTTFSPAHFEGEWDKAGACPRKEPYKEGEKEMEYMDAEMRKIGIDEVARATAAASDSGGGGGGQKKRRGMRIEALDVTRLAMMRADGHPGPYMYPNPFGDGGGGAIKEDQRVQNDCVHWCLPGPIDTWNEILMEIVKSWVGGQ